MYVIKLKILFLHNENLSKFKEIGKKVSRNKTEFMYMNERECNGIR